MGNYLPSTKGQKQEMLCELGYSKAIDLFYDVPEEMLVQQLNLEQGVSEPQLIRKMKTLADKNVVFSSIFRGGGAYDHYIPAIVKRVCAKEEFVTAYTPYQAETSQGILQSIFEYQTMICMLTGMETSNASIYDGATAAAEAVAMCRDRKKEKVLIASTSHPNVIATIKTYCHASGMECEVFQCENGKIDADSLKKTLTNEHAAFYMQQPNFFGVLENMENISKTVHEFGAKLIAGINPIVAAVIKTPAECGADIVVGEGQPLGMPLSFGGPYLGFMATTAALTRKLPGRIAGQTVDSNGKRCFVLTLQAREQHIRRDKASSNVCSNQALCAMTATAYMATLGPIGMQKTAQNCYNNAHYLCDELCKISGVERKYKDEFFFEFVTSLPVDENDVLKELENNNILGGLPVDGGILWCATEKNTKQQIDELVKIVKEVCER